MYQIRYPDRSKFAVDQKNNGAVIIYQHDLIYLLIKFFFTDEFTPSQHTFSTSGMTPYTYKNSLSNSVSEFISMTLGQKYPKIPNDPPLDYLYINSLKKKSVIYRKLLESFHQIILLLVKLRQMRFLHLDSLIKANMKLEIDGIEIKMVVG